MAEPLKKTPLHSLHLELGAKMVPFGGYDMPVQYREGILAEHRQQPLQFAARQAELLAGACAGRAIVRGDETQQAGKALFHYGGSSETGMSALGRSRTGIDLDAGVRARSAWWSSGTSGLVSG